MKNNRPSNTIINGFLLVVAILAIYLVGTFIFSEFQHTKQDTNEKIGTHTVQQNINLLTFLHD
jgi:CHASE3 domain sensor protein